jgi:hypothetical protein
MSKRVGDVSRKRRLASPARIAWYASRRAARFARRCFEGGLQASLPLPRPADGERLAFESGRPAFFGS